MEEEEGKGGPYSLREKRGKGEEGRGRRGVGRGSEGGKGRGEKRAGRGPQFEKNDPPRHQMAGCGPACAYRQIFIQGCKTTNITITVNYADVRVAFRRSIKSSIIVIIKSFACQPIKFGKRRLSYIRQLNKARTDGQRFVWW